MSYALEMAVWNGSDQALRSYSVSHTWHDVTVPIDGTDLEPGAMSESKQIYSGSGGRDTYRINVTFSDGTSKSTDFYCNASSDERYVHLDIYWDVVNCKYWVNIHEDHSSSCMNKSWD
jgi:hypothetical protein